MTSPQPQLEAGYDGVTMDPTAVGRVDLLWVAMHELGHLLGVNSGGATGLDAAQQEWELDDDYDLPPALLDGALVAARRAGGHLAADSSVSNLMESELIPNRRRLPSSTDIGAMAAVGNWTQVDLPRKNFLGGSSLTVAANWMGGRTPDQQTGEEDDVYIRRTNNTGPGNHPSVTLTADFLARDLNILEGSAVATSNRRITATGNTVVDPFFDPLQTRLNVDAGGELETQNLDVRGGAFLIVGNGTTGGTVTVHDTFNIGASPSDSFVIAAGTIDVGERLNNDGVLQTGGALTLNTANTSGNVWNLGGDSRNGRVSVTGGNLTVNGAVPIFNGTITVAGTRVANFSDGWTLGLAGELNLAASSGTATFVSASSELFGDVNVDGEAFFASPIMLWGSSTINLPEFGDNLLLGGANDELHLAGGTITGQGKLTAVGPIFADSGNSTIAVREFDWDGFSSASTTVANGASLTLDVSTFSGPHNGVITVESGGTLDTSASVGPQIAGTLNLAGGTVVAEDLSLQATATLDFSAGQLTANALFVRDGPTINWTGGTMSVKTIVGDIVNDAGVVAPGESHRSGVFGNYTQTGAGTLEIGIGGLVSVTEHDRFTASQTATLGGMLDVSLIDDFFPSLGDTFTIVIAAGGVIDEFDVVNLPSLAGLDWLVNYNANNVILEVIGGLLGDFDADDDVDGADFLDWQRGFGTAFDTNDLADWEANFGQDANAAAYSATVPEPTAELLAALALLIANEWRNRRRPLAV